jgi:hypothetical protein
LNEKYNFHWLDNQLLNYKCFSSIINNSNDYFLDINHKIIIFFVPFAFSVLALFMSNNKKKKIFGLKMAYSNNNIYFIFKTYKTDLKI